MNLFRFTIDEHGVAKLQTSKGTMQMDSSDLPLLGNGALEFRDGYARLKTGAKPCRRLSVARLIMKPGDGLVVDHINHDLLDNRRSNLRVCTRSENCRNGRKKGKTHKYKGVYYHSWGNYTKRWRAYTTIFGKKIWLGYFATEEEAAQAYDEFAKQAFGEFACLNFEPHMGPLTPKGVQRQAGR